MNNKNELIKKVEEIEGKFKTLFDGPVSSLQEEILSSKNLQHIFYTYIHRKAFLMVEQKLREKGLLSDVPEECFKYHDLDKMVMYIFLRDHAEVEKLHGVCNKHHHRITSSTDKISIIENIIDLEAERISKPSVLYTKSLCTRRNFLDINEITYHVMEELGIHNDVNIPDLAIESYELMVSLTSFDDLLKDYRDALNALKELKNQLRC